MKKLITILLFALQISFTKAQQTQTTINGWNAYVHLPASYNSTTSVYPTIIFFPGLGETGTIASKVIANGPGAYISQGWNGNVTIDGNTVEFIVISLQPSANYPAEIYIDQKIQTIKSTYRVDTTKMYLTGLSHGGWCATTYITGDAYGGRYYCHQVAAVVEVEGMKPDDNPYPQLFDNFALSGGRLLAFEQVYDGRDIWTRVARMNAKTPNSAIGVATNFGGGGHCCWNEFYGGQGKQPGKFNLDGISQTIYEWMARQSLIVAPNQPPMANAGIDYVITLPTTPTNTVILTGSGADPDGTIVSYAWTKISGNSVSMSGANTATLTLTGIAAGVYVFELTVTDNRGGIAKDQVTVTVNQCN